MRYAALLAALLASVGLSGCGADKPEADPHAAKAAESLAQLWHRQDLPQDASDCLGRRVVEVLGVAHLQDLRLLTSDYEPGTAEVTTAFSSKADAPRVAEVYVDCLTVPRLMKLAYGKGVDDETADCLADAYGRDRMVEAMTATFEGRSAEEPPPAVTAEMSRCVPTK